jgi:hypothetical protein
MTGVGFCPKTRADARRRTRAHELVASSEQAELYLYLGDQHYFADSSLPSYDPDAATLLTQRALEFLRTASRRAILRRMRALFFVGVVALVLASTSLASSPLPTFEGCSAGAQIRPSAIVVACGDGNFYVTGLKWSRWTKMAATATGLAHQNDCKPYCAAGHFHTYPVALTLSRPEACSNARTEFTRFTYLFTKVTPRSEAHSRTTLKAPFRVATYCP